MKPNQENIDISTWDGTLSMSDFFVAACAFTEKWHRFNSSLPRWSWIHSSKRFQTANPNVEGYLSLQTVLLPSSSQGDQDGYNHPVKDHSISDDDKPVDTAFLDFECKVHYDFHVVYSPSYRVPVLYFRAYYSDGQPLTLDDIEKDFCASSAKLLEESKWTFITQEEHPYLNRPWFTLHPCGTCEWMKLLFSTGDASSNIGGLPVELYFVSWFSVVGQVFGLKIPVAMLCKDQ